MAFSWQDKLASVAEPTQPQSLGDQYRVRQASKVAGGSGSRIYSLPSLPEQRAAALAARPNIYEGAKPPRSIFTDYGQVQRSKYEPRPDESADAFLRRVDNPNNVLNMEQSLPAEEFAGVMAAIEQARAQVQEHGVGTHHDLRARLGDRVGIGGGSDVGSGVIGDGRGLFGMDAGQRAAAVNSQPGVSSFQHLSAWDSAPARPASFAEVRAAMAAKEASQRGQQPQRTQIPAGSSGEGFIR